MKMKKLMILTSAICFACMVVKAEYVNSFTDTAGVTWKLAAPAEWSGGIFDPLTGTWATPPYPSTAIITGANVPSAEAEHLVIPKEAIWATHGDGIYDIYGSPLVTVIRYSAFQNYDALKAVSIPYTVTTIGTPCFKGCSNLSAIKITNGGNKYTELEVAEGSALHSFSSYITVDGVLYNKDKTELLKYPEGKEGDFFAVPASVTKLAPYCFANTKLKAVQFLGDCPRFDSDSTIFSGSSCIVYRYSEANGWKDGAYWADGTSWGGSYVYDFPRSGRREEEGKTVNYEIGNGCLYRYVVDNGEATILSVPRRICGEVSIPSILGGNPVTSIGEWAFEYCSSLTSVAIPGSVTNIDYRAFFGCYALTNVVIGAGVTDVGHGAFAYCSGLVSFSVAADNPAYKSANGLLLTKDGKVLVEGVNGNVAIPDGVSNIGFTAFEGRYGLTSVSIPDSVTSIDYAAFWNCGGLTSIVIPDSMTDIAPNVFTYCSGLSSFSVTVGNPSYKSVNGLLLTKDGKTLVAAPGGLTSIVVPDSVTSIGYTAFYGCSGLTSVTIPGSVTSIGDGAFYGCSGLTSVTIPGSVTSIGESAFESCNKSLYDMTTIPGVRLVDGWVVGWTDALSGALDLTAVRGIGDRAFEYCSSLTSVTIPSGVASIGGYAFIGCNGLTSVIIGDGVICIGEGAFYGCSGLTSVIIGDGVICIGEGAFYGCSGLTSVIIGDGVEYIGYWAFENCSSLTSVVMEGDSPAVEEVSFYGVADGCVVRIPRYASGYDVVDGKWCGMMVAFDGIGVPQSQFTIIDGVLTHVELNGSTSVTIPEIVTEIGESAFADCQDLTSVTIPDSVTSIGYRAFEWCSGLTSITIPDTVTSIGDYAFFGCSGLTSIVIPDSVTAIGDYAFWGCDGLTSVVIPDSVTSIGRDAFSGCNESLYDETIIPGVSLVDGWVVGRTDALSGALDLTGVRGIGDYAFDGCSGLTSIVIPDSVTRIGYGAFYGCNGLTSIVIPDSVMSIGDHAFGDCSGLTSITIPDSVTSIGDWAFEGCSSLVSFEVSSGNPAYKSVNGLLLSKDGTTLISGVNGDVVIPDSVTSIGDRAFGGCSELTSIVIPDSVTSIGYGAFGGCSGLTSVTIPDSVISIGDGAFRGCSGLVAFNVSSGNPDYKSVNGLLLSKDGTTLISGVNGDVIIPDSVTSIGDGAFNGCSGLTSVEIPGSVAEIGYNAFNGCSGLKSVIIGDGVEYIGESAFAHCRGLKSVVIPGSVTGVGDSVFRDCRSLTSVIIGDGVEYIERYAFANCSSLASVTIPDSVTEIGDDAFSGCRGLTNVAIGVGVEYIGEGVFSDCTSLTAFEVASDNPAYKSVNGLLLTKDGETLVASVNGDVAIPDGVTCISEGAFNGCSGLTSVEIPGSVAEIGYNAFSGCSGLKSVIIGDGVEYIGESAFEDCRNLTNITIPDSVTSIGYRAFSGCRGLTSTIIPGSVTGIGDYAFSYCSGLKSVIIGDGVEYIGESAFAHCSGLTSVEIPGSVAEIGYNAFSSCSGLKSVIIGDGVEYIGESAFAHCRGLKSVEIPGSVASICDSAFCDCIGMTSATIGDGVEYIERNAFANCSSLASVTIPDSVTEIGDNAFSGCRGLTCVDIGSGVEYIGEGAFSNCTSLAAFEVSADNPAYKSVNGLLLTKDGETLVAGVNGDVSIPDGVIYISEGAFSGCRGLTSVTIPDSVTEIGNNSFSDCSGLTRVIIGAGVEYIGESAFALCRGLTSMTIPGNVASIGSEAFADCHGLASVAIGSGVEYIGESAFAHCVNLAEVVFDGDKDSVDIADNAFENTPLGGGNIEYVFDYEDNGDGTVTIRGVSPSPHGGLAIPAEIDGKPVTDIGYAAFENCSDLTSVTIPDGVEYIHDAAFENCGRLANVTIPGSVVRLGTAFYGCDESLYDKTTIPGAILVDGWATDYDEGRITSGNLDLTGARGIGDWTFSDCTGLTSVTIGEGVRSIGEGAFSECISLTSVSIGSGVEHIDTCAFEYCRSLDAVSFVGNMDDVYIGAGAFLETPFNDRQDFKFTICGGTLTGFLGCRPPENIVVPDGVTKIADHALSSNCYDVPRGGDWGDVYTYMDGVVSVAIPASVVSIGKYAFEDCISLASVTMAGDAPAVAEVAFGIEEGVGCIVRIPRTAKGYDIVYGKWQEMTVEYYDATPAEPVFTIEDGVLVAVELNGATEVAIPDGVTAIGDFAFWDCSGLTRVTIPASVEDIGKHVFGNCSSLAAIEVAAGNPAYKSINGMLLTKDGKTLVAGVNGDVTIPDGVTYIGDAAFGGRSSLTSVTIPSGVAGIGKEAFAGCGALTDVTLPASVEIIDEWAFACCYELENVTMAGDAPEVVEGAFNDVGADCVVRIPRTAEGYDVVDGKWHGMSVEYYWPETMASGDAYFVVGGTEYDRLEAEPATARVAVPVARTTCDSQAVNILEALHAGAKVPVTIDIVWEAGESEKFVDVALPATKTPGERTELTLKDTAGETLATSAITYVAAQPNSVANPKFIGESIGWGEWTLDYAAAKAKGGYTLAVFSGVLWCPYCIGMENTLFASGKFKNWAKANKVALVLFDQGRASSPATAAGSDEARLLSYAAGDSAPLGGKASGASYLSRKEISQSAAQAAIDETTRRTAQWLAPGSTAARLGNPMVLLLKNDKVVGRLTAARTDSTIYDPSENIARLNDLLLLAARSGEEDDYPSTTTRTIASGSTEQTTFQINDKTECFRIDAPAAGRISATALGARDIKIEILLEDGSVLAGGVNSVAADIPRGAGPLVLRATAAMPDSLGGKSSAFDAQISMFASGAQTSDIALDQVGDRIASVPDGAVATANSDGTVTVALEDGGALTQEDVSAIEVWSRLESNGAYVDSTLGYVKTLNADGTATIAPAAPEVHTGAKDDGLGAEGDASGMLADASLVWLATAPDSADGETVAALRVDGVAGLYYRASWGGELDGMTNGDFVQAEYDGEPLYLGVIMQKGAAGFYRIEVSATKPE